MSFDVLRFLRSNHIDHITGGHKHARPGWVQVHCPFCKGSQDYHLGISLFGEYGSCWRCRGKSITAIVSALLGCPWGTAKDIVQQYSGRIGRQNHFLNPRHGRAADRKEAKVPEGVSAMERRHKLYLESRGFDAGRLAETYGLLGTGPFGRVTLSDGKLSWYKHRIIIPIYLNEKMISYQGRDITGRVGELKYKACPQELEMMDHKDSLYAIDLTKNRKCVVVEGAADVWRLGPGAVGTFGTAFKTSQARMLASNFDTIFVMYDMEPQAQKNALNLCNMLASVGKAVENLGLPEGDPGEMCQDDADSLMRDLGLEGWN